MEKGHIEAYQPYNSQEEADKKLMLWFMEHQENIYARKNLMGHFTASAWVLNENRTKCVMVYHNIYDSWSWVGGHADGECDLLKVALKETKEETGLSTLTPITEEIFSIEVLTVNGHKKKDRYISSHLHFNVTFLLEGKEDEILKGNPRENSGVKWIPLEEAPKTSTEIWMKTIYEKLNKKSSAF